MKKKLIKTIDIGETVICDICGKDYTTSNAKGGILFAGYGVCPKCVPRIEVSAKKENEQQYITNRCPEDMSFREWSLELRKGDNRIKIHKLIYE